MRGGHCGQSDNDKTRMAEVKANWEWRVRKCQSGVEERGGEIRIEMKSGGSWLLRTGQGSGNEGKAGWHAPQ